MMAHSVASSHFGSSRLCGDSAGLKKARVNARRVTADNLLAQGPKGGMESPQAKRHGEIMLRESALRDAADRYRYSPHALHQVLTREARSNTPAEKLAEGRLGDTLLQRVQQKFLETALANPRSQMRAEKLNHLKNEIHQTRPLHGRLSPEMQEQLAQFKVDSDALDAIARAQALQQEARMNAEEMAQLVYPVSSGAQGIDEIRDVRHSDAALDRAHQKTLQRERQLEKQRVDIVKEAMEMLLTWKSHSQVAHALCDALLAMTEMGGEAFKEDMERGGLAVLACTVADLHSDRCEVARCALRLLSTVSIDLLVDTMEELSSMDSIVGLGLEALNRRVKNNDSALDELAKYGGREMLDDLEGVWKNSRMISLHILNLRRRLRRSTTKSIKKRLKVQLPPEDVVKLRETFEAVDVSKKGAIGEQQLGEAMTLLRIQFDADELREAVKEVDLDGSGWLEWPEFLFLMSKFGTNFSIENRFSEERLAEMREVFNIFDADSSGTLDIKELKSVMHSIGLAPEDWEIRAMISEVDSTGSGMIDWPEFLYLMSKKSIDAENQQRLAFEFFLESNNRTGRIKREYFVSQMQRLTSEFSAAELEAMIVQAKFEDSDLNSLTYKEFVKMMMSR